MRIDQLTPVGCRAYGYTSFRSLKDLEVVIPDQPKDPFPDRPSAKDVLLDQIFAVNPVTKLPDSDIQVFMNKNTNDQIKKFIQDNLLADNGGVSDSSKYDLPDEVIAEYTRSSSESAYQYRDRIISLMRKNYSEYRNNSFKGDKS